MSKLTEEQKKYNRALRGLKTRIKTRLKKEGLRPIELLLEYLESGGSISGLIVSREDYVTIVKEKIAEYIKSLSQEEEGDQSSIK